MSSLAKRLQSNLRRSRITLYGVMIPVLGAFTLAGAFDSFKRLLYIVLGFSLIIILHELGHFLMARACSVKCLAFSLFIGPRLCGWRKGGGFTWGKDRYDPEVAARAKKTKADGAAVQAEANTTHSDLPTRDAAAVRNPALGECDYRLSWLPLGGYVRMLGQDDMDPTKVSTDPRAFNQRPVWQRMLIISAGVTMNVIFAFVAFTIIFSPGIGVDFPPAVLGQVVYGSPADKAGLKLGDSVQTINGKKPLGFLEFSDLQIASALSTGKEPLHLVWTRPGVDHPMEADVTPANVDNGSGNGLLGIGVSQIAGLNIVRDKDILQDSLDARKKQAEQDHDVNAAELTELAKFGPRDRIVAVDGHPLDSYYDLYNDLQRGGGSPVSLLVKPAPPTKQNEAQRPDYTVTLSPELMLRPGAKAWPTLDGLSPLVRVKATVDGSGADKGGVKPGDLILRVGDRDYPGMEELRNITKSAVGSDLPVMVLRDGQKVALKVHVNAVKGVGQMGIQMGLAMNTDWVAVRDLGAAPNLPVFSEGGLVRVATLDGKPVKDWSAIYDHLRKAKPGSQMTLGFAAAGATTQPTMAAAATTQPAMAAAGAPATAVASAANVPETATFDVTPELSTALSTQTEYLLNVPVEVYTRVQRADNYYTAGLMGLQHTVKFIEEVYSTLRGIVIGTVPASNLHGIVGITKIGYDIQGQRGVVWLWYVLAMVSADLAVANFLPLPIVDGGLFLLLILEKVRGKPLSLKVQSAIQLVGIVLLAGLFLFVTYNDLSLFH